jgi:hypothetical protein
MGREKSYITADFWMMVPFPWMRLMEGETLVTDV